MSDVRRLRSRTGLYLLVGISAFVMLFPFLWTVITSITTDGNLNNGPEPVGQEPDVGLLPDPCSRHCRCCGSY